MKSSVIGGDGQAREHNAALAAEADTWTVTLGSGWLHKPPQVSIHQGWPCWQELDCLFSLGSQCFSVTAQTGRDRAPDLEFTRPRRTLGGHPWSSEIGCKNVCICVDAALWEEGCDFNHCLRVVSEQNTRKNQGCGFGSLLRRSFDSVGLGGARTLCFG